MSVLHGFRVRVKDPLNPSNFKIRLRFEVKVKVIVTVFVGIVNTYIQSWQNDQHINRPHPTT